MALWPIERAAAGSRDGWYGVRPWASQMTSAPVNAAPQACSLYQGAPAVAFSLHTSARAENAVQILDEHIGSAVRLRLEQAHDRINQGLLPRLSEYDLISGLTGFGVYLLHRHGGGSLLSGVLEYLVRLSQPVSRPRGRLPGWWCATAPNGQRCSAWPGGHANLGLAHGIAGPVALMALAARRGLTVTGQFAAIERICVFLDHWQHGTGTHAWWPGLITPKQWRQRRVGQRSPNRPSWCYGTPGLARAHQIAGIALNDPARKRKAEEALAGAATSEAQLRQLHDAGLCHGWAGLLLTVLRAAAEADTGMLTSCIPRLRERLDRHLDRHGVPAAGLLTGSTGIHLAQHAAEAGPPVTGWDTCLLLTG